VTDFKSYTDSELLSALLSQTANYSRLVSLRELRSEEFAECKRTLNSIQEELDLRHPSVIPGDITGIV